MGSYHDQNDKGVADLSFSITNSTTEQHVLESALEAVGTRCGISGKMTPGRAIRILEDIDRNVSAAVQIHGAAVVGSIETFRQKLVDLSKGKISPHKNVQALQHLPKMDDETSFVNP